MLSFHERNWLIFTSGDTLLRVLCFYLMLANPGAAYSIDSLLRAMREQAAVTVSRWNRILIKYQASVLYFMAAFAKTGAHWLAGTAVSYVLINPYFARTPLYWLAGKPVLGKIMTWGALAIEWTVPFLLWFAPTRLIAIALVVLLQGFIFATMDIGTFPLISTVVVLIFLEKTDLDRFWKLFGRKTYTVYYDGACDFCTSIVRGLYAMDVCGKLTFADFRKKKHDSDMEKQLWLVGDKTYKGFYAFRKIAWLIPALWITIPFLYLPFAGFIGTKVYNYIACKRFSCKRL
jgi:predicted DCC family thiol-disulfide oxidoreductase YuxK